MNMGSMLRSDIMTFCDIYLQHETAFEILTHLGEMGCVQFIDMTPDVKPQARKYISEVCRCSEMERKLVYMEGEIRKDKIPIAKVKTEPNALQLKDMTALETLLEQWEREVLEMSESQSTLLNNYLELTEMYYVLKHIGPMMGDANSKDKSLLKRLNGEDAHSPGLLYMMTGVVKRNKCFTFEMILWRISHGNIYYRQAAEDKVIRHPVTGREIRKVAFLAVCQGEQLSIRMEKVCRGFRAGLYPCPQNYEERVDMMNQLRTRISDVEQVMKKMTYHRCKTLRTIANQLASWMVQTKKSKAVYHTMNLFSLDITKKCLIGQCWVPEDDLPQVMDTLSSISKKAGTNVSSFISKTQTSVKPPTYHRTNKFTKGFQALINAYGDSTYRELNPGLYTIITFPFLFAVMFGDVCHGLILVMFAAWMVSVENKYMNKRSDNEIWKILFGGRYVILLMGLFTLYTGFVYNVFFCKAIALVKPYWNNHFTLREIENNHYLTLDPATETNAPYMFGVDPVWELAKNKIVYLNSIKMKMSLIIGIVHMIFALILSVFNHIYFKKYYAIVLQFVPQIIFFTLIFFWLVILMFMKWFMYSAKEDDVKRGPGCAPLILIIFIDMMLFSTTKPVEEGCDAYMFPGQKLTQNMLLFIGLICVPVLLFGTPVYLNKQLKKEREKTEIQVSQFRRYQKRDSEDSQEKRVIVLKESTGFGALMIHQAVETIEFVLSTISHTASYLRLWALSLAHEQLSDMLWEMIFSDLALRDTSLMGGFKIFVVFAIWAVFSVCILIIMEGLSAFLHTLRLHWVEFMSKFYSGKGWNFTPFSFRQILSAEGRDDHDTFCKNK